MTDPELHLSALRELTSVDRVSMGVSDREPHSPYQSAHMPHLPDLVVWPESTEEVSCVACYATEHRIPLTGWGAGSSLGGNPIPLQGGIVMDFSRINRILTIYAEDFQVCVQPGMLYKDTLIAS